MTQNFCTECGIKLNGAEQYCTECGTKIQLQSPQPTNTNNTYINPYNAIPKNPQPLHLQDSRYQPLSMGAYFAIFVLMLIPIVNIILLIVWATGSTNKVDLRNFARAALLFILVCAIGFTIVFVLIGGVIELVVDYLMGYRGYSYDYYYDYNYDYSSYYEDIKSSLTQRTFNLYVYLDIL